MRCCKALISISLHRVMDDAIFARTTVSTIASSDFRHLLRVDDFLGVATAGILWDIPISLTPAPGVCEIMTLKVNWKFFETLKIRSLILFHHLIVLKCVDKCFI